MSCYSHLTRALIAYEDTAAAEPLQRIANALRAKEQPEVLLANNRPGVPMVAMREEQRKAMFARGPGGGGGSGGGGGRSGGSGSGGGSGGGGRSVSAGRQPQPSPNPGRQPARGGGDTVWPGGSPPWVFDPRIGGPNPNYPHPDNPNNKKPWMPKTIGHIPPPARSPAAQLPVDNKIDMSGGLIHSLPKDPGTYDRLIEDRAAPSGYQWVERTANGSTTIGLVRTAPLVEFWDRPPSQPSDAPWRSSFGSGIPSFLRDSGRQLIGDGLAQPPVGHIWHPPSQTYRPGGQPPPQPVQSGKAAGWSGYPAATTQMPARITKGSIVASMGPTPRLGGQVIANPGYMRPIGPAGINSQFYTPAAYRNQPADVQRYMMRKGR